MRQGIVVAGAAINRVACSLALRLGGRIPLAIVRHEQIEAPVVVVIDPGGSDGPHLLAVKRAARYAGLGGDVGERAVAVVVEQLVAIDVGHVEIGPPVVVVVTHGDAHTIALAAEAGFVGHVGEGEVPVVVKQLVLELRVVFLERRDVRSVHEVQVQEPVSVIVEDRNTRDQSLRLLLLRRGAVRAREPDTGLLSDLFKSDGTGCRHGSKGEQRGAEQEAAGNHPGACSQSNLPPFSRRVPSDRMGA